MDGPHRDTGGGGGRPLLLSRLPRPMGASETYLNVLNEQMNSIYMIYKIPLIPFYLFVPKHDIHYRMACNNKTGHTRHSSAWPLAKCGDADVQNI